MKVRTLASLSVIVGVIVLFNASGLAEPKKPADSDPTATSSWKQLKLPDPAAKNAFRNVFFLDAKHGWAVGDKGLCLATQDGGDNWKVRDTGSGATLRCIWFQDAQTGWACGEGDANAPRTGGHVVLNRPLKAGTVLSTGDGGKTWRTSWVSTNFDIPWIEASTAPLLQIGVSGGEFHLDGDITRSLDGGKTWKSNRCFRSLFAVRRIDDKRWLAVGSPVSVGFLPTPTSELYTNKQCRALYSADGGESWKVSRGSDGEGSLRAIAVDKKRAVLAVGDRGTILRSEDQGEKWSVMEAGTKADLLAVAWVSGAENTVVAVGEEGTVLVSSDGGKKWRSTVFPTTCSLRSVASAGDHHMIAAGSDGSLWRVPVKQLASLPLRARKSKEVEEKREAQKAEERSLQRLNHTLEGVREMAKRYPPDSDEAKKAAESIKQLEAIISGRPYLGVSLVPNTTEIAQVLPQGPANVAGIKKGDILVKWGDTPITKGEDLARAVMQQKPGDKVVVEIQRDGKFQKITVEVEKRPIPRE